MLLATSYTCLQITNPAITAIIMAVIKIVITMHNTTTIATLSPLRDVESCDGSNGGKEFVVVVFAGNVVDSFTGMCNTCML